MSIQTPPPSTPVFIITGCTSGFGRSIAFESLSRGHAVIATARNSSRLSELQAAGAAVMDLDVTSTDDTLNQKMAEANALYGRITHVVNCAGYILEGGVEEASSKEVFDHYNTNVLGTFNVARAVVKYLRAAAAVPGQQVALANFGSLGSWSSGAGVAHCNTKFAVSGLTEGLAEELKPFGIDVCVVEPGYTQTGKVAAYQGTAVAAVHDALETYNGKQPGDVDKSAKVLVDVLTKSGVAKDREVPVRLALGADTLEVIRKKCEDTLRLNGEWEDISRSTMRDEK
ncbi:hypothetical protein QBC32DRAFT_367072 [Pseudoneurospora amorphoporcata]|uniref:Uncharacterized protein n=1 Tax=Pseudoneurospora amorphoporcata TaxID=241081 RepID=A0AAN6P247_9PEZI|nr:hypothetical protein QBC32DRAFT_367072 [Pseudoneurospora amorphoporcata]